MIPNLFTKRQVNIYKYIIFFRKYELLAVVRLLKKENHLSILGVMLIVILYIVFDVSVSHRSISSR